MVISDKEKEKLDIDFVISRLAVASPYGERLRRSLSVFSPQNKDEILRQFDLLDKMLALFLRKRSDILAAKALLAHFKPLEGSIGRLKEGSTLSMVELHEIKTNAFDMLRLGEFLEEKFKWKMSIGEFILQSPRQIIEILDPNNEGTTAFHLYSSYSSKLMDIRNQIAEAKQASILVARDILEAFEKEGFSVVHQIVQVKKTDSQRIAQAEADGRLTYRSDSPTMRGYYVTASKEYQDKVEELKREEEIEELEVRKMISRKLLGYSDIIEGNIQKVANIDLLMAKAQFTDAYNLVRPEITDHISFEGAWHMKLRHTLRKERKDFTPIDIDLDNKITVVTGANMGGKTVSIKLIGQLVVMAQMGFFLPCKSAKVKIFDKIFISVGDFQSLDLGLSTFGSEIVKLGEAIESEFKDALFLLDELARGTNPDEGAAISMALLEHLSTLPLNAVITTHYDGIIKEDMAHYQVAGLYDADLSKVEASALHEHMDYRLIKVEKERKIPREAIRIANYLGLNESILERARQILGGSK